jgi:poly-gamma-glutamate synthesis protein (capsule biosynthesis protein)
VRVLFLGDIMTHGQQLKYARTDDGFDFSRQFARIKPLLRKAMVVGNLETTLAGPAHKYSGYPSFNSPDELGRAVSELGVHVVTLANNHILDKGFDGAARTADALDSLGILRTGLSDRDVAPGQPLLVEYGGLRWAMVNFTYGSNVRPRGENPRDIAVNVISEDAVRESLRAARELGPDVTVALFHWGNEYQTRPHPSQVRIAELAAAEGADLVIGTHPHVLQPVTFVPTERGMTLVAYSLGNFISNQRQPPRERSAVLAVEFARLPRGGARLHRVAVAPVYVSSGCRKAEGCVIQLLYGGDAPPEAEPAAPPPADRTQVDEEGVPVHSLYLYDGPAAGDNDVAAGQAPAGADGAGEAGEPVPAAGEGDPAVPEAPVAAAGRGGDGRGRGGGIQGDGEGGDQGLPAREAARALKAGGMVLDFLGARGDPDAFGYYTLWDASAPGDIPLGSRKSPH